MNFYILVKIKENISKHLFGTLYLCLVSWERIRELEERVLFLQDLSMKRDKTCNFICRIC